MYPGIWRRRDASSFGYPANNHFELTLITPPAAEPVSLTDLKGHAHIPYADNDSSLALLLTAARESVEAFLRRSLITQTWDMTLDWGPAWVELPRAPLQSITGVFTTGLDNVEVTVDPSVYIVNTPQSFLGLNIGQVWPLHRGKAGFRVRYVSGYGSAPSAVPAAIRQTILAMATAMELDRSAPTLPSWAETALQPYRILGEVPRMAKGMAREDLLA